MFASSLRLLGLATLSCCFALRAAAEDVPRYRLEVGDVLNYDNSSSFKYKNGSFDNYSKATFWVTEDLGEKGWRLLARNEKLEEKEGKPSSTTLAHFVLSPDGRIESNSSFGFRFNPGDYFPRLPEDAKVLTAGWQVKDKIQDNTHNYQAAKEQKSDQVFTFEDDIQSPFNKIYDSTSAMTYHFDREKGVVTNGESRSTQGFGFDGKGSGTVVLTSQEKLESASLGALAKAAEGYFAANKEYESLIKQSSKEPEKVKEHLENAKSVLETANGKNDQADVAEVYKQALTSHENAVSYYTESANRQAEVVGKPAPGWETTDFKGTTHSLEQYKGKVVVLDFWYRGCGWCIRAMPQMNQLAEQFAGKEVAILGMNTDSQEENALFVIDAMGLTYPNLKATGIPEKYGVRGFPTLVIIDPSGNTHSLHVGYSPTLAEDVGKEIRQLLVTQKPVLSN